MKMRITSGTVTLLATVMVLTSLQAFPSEERSFTQGRFPLLDRLAVEGTPITLSDDDRRDLLEEVVVERLLWHDELTRLRDRARASAETLARIDGVEEKVLGELGALEESIQRGIIDERLLRRVLGPGDGGVERRERSIISGGSLRLPEATHRGVVLNDAVPPHYWDSPSAAFEISHTKAQGEVDRVAELVADLGGEPVALYRHVVHEISPVIAFGLSRSPEGVLASGVGTGADQAALLVELLRAAGYPARMVWGVQELSVEALNDHLGLQGAPVENALTTGGFAWSPVVEAGHIVAYRVSRVWCEVWIGFADFRGVVLDPSGSTWLPLDPWIKGYGQWDDRRILDEVVLDADDLRQRFLSGQFCSGDLDQPGACPSLVEALTTEVEAYLLDHGETISFDDLAVGRQNVLEEEDLLPAAMVGPIVSIDGYGIELPESLHFRLGLRATAGQETLLDTTLDVAGLSAGEAVLWYEPAAEADADVIDALGGSLWDVPPYLVNVVPVVMVGQEIVARAEAPGRFGIGMGERFTLELTMATPSGLRWTWTNTGLAGVPVGLGVSVGHQGYVTPYDEPASTVQLLSKLASDYLDGVVEGEERLAAVDQMGVTQKMPSVVAVSSVIEPEGTLGMVTNMEFLGIQVDADLWGSEVAGAEIESRKRWRVLSRLNASTLERGLFEDYEITSVSADMALILAETQGIEILHIDQGNLGSALAQLDYDPNIESEIEAWVLSGGEAEVPLSPLSFIEWTGVGYVLTDPITGEAKYQLAGGLSGGMTVLPAGFEFEQLPQLWPASDEEAIDDPSAAAVLKITAGLNGQIGQAGSEAGAAPDGAPVTRPLQVTVLTETGVAVKNVEVTFEVREGNGHFLDENGGEVTQTVVSTDRRGVARVRFVFDQLTGTVPYFTQLDSGDPFATRVGANLIRMTTAPTGLMADVWAFSAPGPLDEADVTHDQWSTTPEMLAGRAQVVARDALGNPIANAETSVGIISGGGALLTSDEFDNYVLGQGGTILLSDVSSPQTVIDNQTTTSDGKFSTYVILGLPDDGDVDIRFFVAQGGEVRHDETTMAKGSPDDGTILYSWSARPTGSWGQWIEAYPPGSEIVLPMVLDLFRITNGHPVRATADELRAEFWEPSVLCPEGTMLVPAHGGATVGRWATGLQLGTTPGHCELYATIEKNNGDGVWWPVLLTDPSPTVWAVEMELWVDPERNVIVGVENTPVEEERFTYYILPAEYEPERTAIKFRVGEHISGVVEAPRWGDGILTVEPGMIELDPKETCTVQGVLNSGVYWGAGTDNSLDLQLPFEMQELKIKKARVHIAMDGNRDDIIEFDETGDQRYLFWVNDDYDVMHHNEVMFQEDDKVGDPDCDDNYIGNHTWIGSHACKRDLEDFTRLQFQADDVAEDLSGLVYSLKFESDSTDDPSVNIFEAVDCTLNYLRDTGVADPQIKKERLFTVDGVEAAVIDSQYISPGSEESCFILEGKTKGKGDLTLRVKKNGILLSEESVALDLRPIDEFYEKFVVHLSFAGEVEPMSMRVGNTTYVPENNEYVLFVHGYNVPEYTTDRWAETVFKRLWWLGYKGHLGAFRWPEVEGFFCLSDPTDFSCYNESDYKAWNSARALRYLLPDLDSRFPGQIRILAHSQGNIVTGEALRQLQEPLNLRYIAAQAAVPALTYDNTVPPYSHHAPWHPDVYGHYYSGAVEDSEYLSSVLGGSVRMFRYYNKADFALFAWRLNNDSKAMAPFSNYRYLDSDGDPDTYNPDGEDKFYLGVFNQSGWLTEIRETYQLPEDTYKIFSFCARSRSLALGAVETPIGGFEGETNLQDFGYDWQHYSHSKQFRSNIVDEWDFWVQVKTNFNLASD